MSVGVKKRHCISIHRVKCLFEIPRIAAGIELTSTLQRFLNAIEKSVLAIFSPSGIKSANSPRMATVRLELMDEEEELKIRQAELEALLEQIDQEQEIVDDLEMEIEYLIPKSPRKHSFRQSVRFAAPPDVSQFPNDVSQIRELNAEIAKCAAERRLQLAKLEKVLQRRAQICDSFELFHQTLLALQEDFDSRTKKNKKARKLLARLQGKSPESAVPENLRVLLGRIAEVESKIGKVDREIAGFGGQSREELCIELEKLRRENAILSVEVPTLNDQYGRLQGLVAKWGLNVEAQGSSRHDRESVSALLDELDRKRVGANPMAVFRGRSMLSADIAAFDAEQQRICSAITDARMKSQIAEATLIEEIGRLRIAVASIPDRAVLI
jgi:DNA repair exonuclease SbcCD ATPase subunit